MLDIASLTSSSAKPEGNEKTQIHIRKTFRSPLSKSNRRDNQHMNVKLTKYKLRNSLKYTAVCNNIEEMFQS